MESFQSDLDEVLRTHGDILLKVHQREALEYIYMQERDCIVCLPTGYGKSLIFHLLAPLLRLKKGYNSGSVLVISPLNIIQRDQLISIRERGLRACRLSVSGKGTTLREDDDFNECIMECDASLEDIESGVYDVILCHPEALFSTPQGAALLNSQAFQDNVLAVVIDECHTVDKWSRDFRKAFGQIDTLPTFLSCPTIALSATLTSQAMDKLPGLLNMQKPKIIKANPDKPNIFLSCKKKMSNYDIIACAESVYMPIVDELYVLGPDFPVTLLYMPIEWCSQAQIYALDKFDHPSLHSTSFITIFSLQDEEVLAYATNELRKDNPHIRLIFCTSSVGMGFDSPSVSRVIHGKPPRNIVDYIQQIGRSGRQGQSAVAVLHFNDNDIAKNVPHIEENIINYCRTKNCLRLEMLKVFGFEEAVASLDKCRCCSNCAIKCQCELCTKE